MANSNVYTCILICHVYILMNLLIIICSCSSCVTCNIFQIQYKTEDINVVHPKPQFEGHEKIPNHPNLTQNDTTQKDTTQTIQTNSGR